MTLIEKTALFWLNRSLRVSINFWLCYWIFGQQKCTQCIILSELCIGCGFGGDEESRTPVRKSRLTAFSESSYCFGIPPL